MSSDTHDDEIVASEWEPCPAGYIARLSDQLKRRNQRRIFLRTAAAVAAVAATGGGLSLWMRSGSSRQPSFAGLTCAQVIALADDYAHGRLSDEAREKVRQHISQCPGCGRHFRTRGLPT
jgi:hypothetical protein